MAIKTIDLNTWQFPALPDEIPHGDMPGDKVEIGENMEALNKLKDEGMKKLSEKGIRSEGVRAKLNGFRKKIKDLQVLELIFIIKNIE